MKKPNVKTIFRLAIVLSFAMTCFMQNACTPSRASTVDLDSHLGKDLPPYSLRDLNGIEVTSESLKGKFVVIHVATTWCPFCNAEAPTLEQIYKDYKDKGVEVLIIDVKEPGDLVQRVLVDRFNLTFPVLLDKDGAVAASFAPTDVLPELARDDVMLASNLLIDPEGKIRFFSLLDTNNFDAKLIKLKSKLDELL